MAPDSVESKISRLEREMSALQQEVQDLSRVTQSLSPVKEAVARIEEQLKQLFRLNEDLNRSVREDREAAQKRGAEMRAELEEFRDEVLSNDKSMRNRVIITGTSIITTFCIFGGAILGVILGGG